MFEIVLCMFRRQYVSLQITDNTSNMHGRRLDFTAGELLMCVLCYYMPININALIHIIAVRNAGLLPGNLIFNFSTSVLTRVDRQARDLLVEPRLR